MKSKPAVAPESSAYSRTSGVEFEKIMYQVGKGTIDVNTALRTAAEKADIEIAKLKAG